MVTLGDNVDIFQKGLLIGPVQAGKSQEERQLKGKTGAVKNGLWCIVKARMCTPLISAGKRFHTHCYPPIPSEVPASEGFGRP